MELSQVEAFYRVAREGSFTRAAELLGLTQPAVSTRISTLESELGGRLFQRRGRTLMLTPVGERFLPYAQRMLAVMADGMQSVRDFQKGERGEVRIAAPTPFVMSFLQETLMEFHRRAPGVDILIRERDKLTIVELLRDYAVTLGLVNAPVFDQSFASLAAFRDPIVAVVGREHPLGQSTRPLQVSDIQQHTVFRVSMFPQMTAFVDDVVEAGRRATGGAVIAVPMVLARELTIRHQGITFLPSAFVRTALESGALVTIKLEDMPELYSEPTVVSLRDRELDNAHRAFVEVLTQQWQPLLRYKNIP